MTVELPEDNAMQDMIHKVGIRYYTWYSMVLHNYFLDNVTTSYLRTATVRNN